MGRGRNKHSKRPAMSPDSDNESQSPHDGNPSENGGNESELETSKDISTQYLELLDTLTVKSAAPRINAYFELRELLQSNPDEEMVQKNAETLEYYSLSSLKRGGPKEVSRMCEALKIATLILGGECLRIYNTFRPVMEEYIRDPKKPSASQGDVASALALLCFIASEEKEDTTEVMELFLSLISKNSKKNELATPFLVGCLNGWSLLATVEKQELLAGEVFDNAGPYFMELLHHDNIEVRAAAGEALVIAYDAYLKCDEPLYLTAHSKHGVDLDELHEILNDLAEDSSKRKTKKDRAHQRQVFREILASIEDEMEPTEQVSIGSKRHTFTGWCDLRRLESMRSALRGGLQTHFVSNSLLGEIFGIDIDHHTNLSKEEVKAHRKKQIQESKVASKEMFLHKTKERKKKKSHQHTHSDDEDKRTF